MTLAGARKFDAWTHLGDGMMGCVTAMELVTVCACV